MKPGQYRETLKPDIAMEPIILRLQAILDHCSPGEQARFEREWPMIDLGRLETWTRPDVGYLAHEIRRGKHAIQPKIAALGWNEWHGGYALGGWERRMVDGLGLCYVGALMWKPHKRIHVVQGSNRR